MRSMLWKAGLAGAAIIITTVYGAAQMVAPGQTPQGHTAPEQMTTMMQLMSQMMEHCGSMMRGSPHGRGNAPAVPEKKD